MEVDQPVLNKMGHITYFHPRNQFKKKLNMKRLRQPIKKIRIVNQKLVNEN